MSEALRDDLGVDAGALSQGCACVAQVVQSDGPRKTGLCWPSFVEASSRSLR